jgi:protoporphyrinogen oxidase
VQRRTFLGLVAGALAAPAIVGLRRKTDRPLAGGFVGDAGTRGHRLRQPSPSTSRAPARRIPVVIVGGGIAGLSAAWELDRRGMRDFVLLELESTAGGNSRSGENGISAFPWAAHYVPVPGPGNVELRELFTELGVLRDGVWDERHLCFAPQERLYQHGEWHASIEPTHALDVRGRAAFQRFAELVDEQRASGGFTIPMAGGVEQDSALDRLTMAEWLSKNGLDDAALRWYVDYACRDDYGARARAVSAWAGIHYFAARDEAQHGPLTWPEGNGWIAKRMIARVGDRLRADSPALRIERRGNRWLVRTPGESYDADGVIFTAPSFVAPYIVSELAAAPPRLEYSPWITANLVVDRWPKERGAGVPAAWDNVIYDSPSLGYVVATHQSLSTISVPTVWTYYWSLADETPAQGRAMLRDTTWHQWVERILSDLERAHPDIRDCVSRMDVMRLGHAMIRPTPGFLSATRALREREPERMYFANSDVSGLPLFEEAHFRGVGAARRVLSAIG